MTKEDHKKYLDDMHRYEPAILLGRLHNSKDEQSKIYLPGAFGILGKRWGVKEGELEGLVNGALASKEGTEISVGTYFKKYWDAAGKLNLGEFCDYYKDIIKKYLGNKAESIKNKIADYIGENLGTLRKRISYLSYKTESPDAKENEDAQEKLKKYENVISLFNVIEDEKYITFLPEAIEMTNKARLERIAA